ncbi:Dolichyl-phosphate-mannose-protein mannosyltransferase [Singulisphaera sp. GP187]|uniref:glycosyltransferase family 39 protein n=1 Tax=Singulisphaera sp. GP187 TaxID=1882752 RepID=UPI0009276DE0|nr:glycosyltransferase family 39 protein [Singulisphaera sp. GP187]SIO14925.1 Dolichyl-phosphate-mannose-protein mannosyltransferase [Singulisphaera sp. GP187]
MSQSPTLPTGHVRSQSARVAAIGWPLAIVLLSLVLRGTVVRDFVAHPLGRLPWVDEGAYWTRAQAILNGAWLPDRPFYQDPLYPYLLAGLMRVVGTEVSSLRVALACLGALTPLAVYGAGRLGFGPVEGRVAGLLCAACGPLIFTDGLLEKESLAALGAAIALGLTAWAANPAGRAWRATGSGLAWGIVSLLRANALVLAPLGAIWWLLADSRHLTVGRRRAKALLFLLGFALAIAPATIVNAVVSRPTELILTTWQGGANFYIGNGPEATGTYVAPPFVEANPAHEADDFAEEATRRSGRRLSHTGVSRFWLDQGLKRWWDAPAASLRLLAAKIGLLAHNFEIPDNQDFEFVRLVAVPHLSWGVISFGTLLPLAALSLGLGREERTPFWSFLILSTGAGLGTTALFFVVGRYRIPWFPGLALLGAAGAVDMGRRLARRQWRGLGWRVCLLVLPAAALAWRPMVDPTPDRWGHAEIELALAFLAEGSLEPAINALDDVRALGEGPSARVTTLLAEGPVHDRLAALVLNRLNGPRHAGEIPQIIRARWLRQLPETRAESRRRLEGLLRSQPDDPAVRREWGAWWLDEANDPEARRHAKDALARAIEAPGGDASAAVLLALLTTDPLPLAGLTSHRSVSLNARVRLAQAIVIARSRPGRVSK